MLEKLEQSEFEDCFQLFGNWQIKNAAALRARLANRLSRLGIGCTGFSCDTNLFALLQTTPAQGRMIVIG